MRVPLLLLLCLIAAPLAAQEDAAPADAAAAAATQPAPPTCAELQAQARAEHDAAEAARQAASGDGARRVFFFTCPLNAAAEPEAQEDDWSLPITAGTARSNSFGFGEDRLAPQDPRPNRTATTSTTTERCTGNLLDQTCELRSTATVGRNGEVQSERRCRQDGLTQACESSGTISFGDSEDGRNAARDALERMRDDGD